MIYMINMSVHMYNVLVWRFDVQVPSDYVAVKYVDDMLIIRRGSGTPKQAVAGRADVVVGLDERGRIVNVEIEFADYYFFERGEARKVLKRAVW